jgi:hypothetical protein
MKYRAKVIPANPQIHANVMLPLCVLIFYFFIATASTCIRYSSFLDIVNAELIESPLKQTIMCLCFDDFLIARKMYMRFVLCLHLRRLSVI